ncbi:MAG: hypothetical protein AAB442_00785 [Patescibacteria group bacterium]
MLFNRILDFLFPPRVDEVLVREISTDVFLAHLRPVLIVETRPETTGLLPFHTPLVRATLHEAKYHRNTHAFDLLATALADYLHDIADENYGHRKSVIVPVPLGALREKERGYNQVTEVVRKALCELGPNAERFTLIPELLTRTRETRSQVSLPREERLVNMRGAFTVTAPLDSAATYIVIDDVITTGATLQAAIDALRAAGARTILPLALAH